MSAVLRSAVLCIVCLAALMAADDIRTQRLLERFAKLDYRTGTVAVAGDRADLALPDGYRFLGREDAQWVETELMGNPPDANTLGMVVPAGIDLGEAGGWVIFVSYSDEGHIDDSDARSTDFAELLRQMQEGARRESAQRQRAGYEAVRLVGWAEPPHYDAAAKKLYWAKRLQFGATPDHTLNYDVRILGRTGTLVYTAVSGMEQLSTIKEGCNLVLAATSFRPGHRYEDFDRSKDKVAEYGIAGLIAGGGLLVAKKAGILAVLLKFLLKGGFLLFAPLLWLLGKLRGKPAPVRRTTTRRTARQDDRQDLPDR